MYAIILPILNFFFWLKVNFIYFFKQVSITLRSIIKLYNTAKIKRQAGFEPISFKVARHTGNMLKVMKIINAFKVRFYSDRWRHL